MESSGGVSQGSSRGTRRAPKNTIRIRGSGIGRQDSNCAIARVEIENRGRVGLDAGEGIKAEGHALNRGIKDVEMTCPRFPMWVKARAPSFHAGGGTTYQRYCKP